MVACRNSVSPDKAAPPSSASIISTMRMEQPSTSGSKLVRGGVGKGGHRRVVVADDGQIAPDAQPRLRRGPHRANGQPIRGTEQRRGQRSTGKQSLGQPEAVLFGRFGFRRGLRAQAGGLHGMAKTGGAVMGKTVFERGIQHGDASVAKPDQPLRRGLEGGAAIHVDEGVGAGFIRSAVNDEG